MTDDKPSWIIEVSQEFPAWSYRAYKVTDGLPSAISLRGLAWSRNGALAKAQKHIGKVTSVKEIERVEFYG